MYGVALLLGTLAAQVPFGFLLIVGCGLLGFWQRANWIYAALVLLGFSLATWSIYQRTQHTLPHALENKMTKHTVDVISLPSVTRLRVQFIGLIDNQYRAQISWYRHQGLRLKPGQRWCLTLKLKRPRGVKNPGGFDYGRYLISQNIMATGSVVNRGENVLQGQTNQYLLSQWRYQYLERLKKLGEQELMPFYQALVFGVRDELAYESKQRLARTGTSHLLAISGLHIGMMSALFYWGVNLLWRVSAYGCLRFPAPRAGAIAAIMGAWLYALLAGLSIPTQRAAIMVTVFMLGQVCARHTRVTKAYGLSLLLVLLWDPLAAMTASFWLSFVAVGLFLYALKGRGNFLKAQAVVQLGLMPVSLNIFHGVALGGFFANLLAIPLVTFIILPLSLLSLIIPTSMFLLEWPVKFLWLSLSYFDWGMWVRPLSLPNCIVLMGLVLLILSSRPQLVRLSALIVGVGLLAWPIAKPKQGEIWLSQLDVGQGLATVIQTRNHALVFDTGAKSPSGFDMGQAVVVPYLHYRGIRYLDKLLISHDDNDHRGGGESIALALGTPMLHCFAGDSWEWDGVRFEVLHPNYIPQGRYRNNDSCVLKISNAAHRVLLTGDIESDVELALVQQYGDKLSSDVLIAPHHGSKTSSSTAFIQAVNPATVIYSTGYLNQYRFPHAIVVARYKGVQQLNTATMGAVVMKLGPDSSKKLLENK